MYLKLFLIALPIFLLGDFIWLGLIARKFYWGELGSLVSSNINIPVALIFYLIFVAGLVFFVISPSVEKASWIQALILGAFFGFISYATYDLTNLATIKDWPLSVTIVDLVWGTFLAATVSTLTFVFYNSFFNK